MPDAGGVALPAAPEESGVGTACGVAGSEVGSVVGAGDAGLEELGDEALFGAGLLQALASSASPQTIGRANR